jgi:hypothetical protein
MSTEDDARDAAIKRYNDRAAQGQQAAAEERRQRDAKAHQQEKDFAAWPTASNAIYFGVNSTSEHFARGGSEFLISAVPTTERCTATYAIRPSGKPDTRKAWFKFAMDGDGVVRIETDARGVVDLPAAVAVADVGHDWARKVANQIMIAALDS